MTIPPEYTLFLRSLAQREITFGFGGLALCAESELAASAQVGYSVSASGDSLPSSGEGAWQKTWMVIGRDMTAGDPLFLDTAEPSLSVMIATHGEGTWVPQSVASSLAAFSKLLAAFAAIADGRSNPDDLENRPPTSAEVDRYLRIVLAEEKASGAYLFWDMLLEDYSRFMGEAPAEFQDL